MFRAQPLFGTGFPVFPVQSDWEAMGSEVKFKFFAVCLMTAKCTSERNSREMPEYPDSKCFYNTSARKLSTLVSENTGLLSSDVMSAEEQTFLCQAMESLIVGCDVDPKNRPSYVRQ